LVGRHLEGASQDRRNLVRPLDLHAPLGDRRGDRREVVAEHGIAQAQPRVLLARRHHHGRIVLERAVDMADGVAQPGRHMQVHERRLAARLGVEIGRADRDAFVQVDDVLDRGVVDQRIEQRALGGAGIAENPFHPVSQQCLKEHLSPAHFSPPAPLLTLRSIAWRCVSKGGTSTVL